MSMSLEVIEALSNGSLMDQWTLCRDTLVALKDEMRAQREVIKQTMVHEAKLANELAKRHEAKEAGRE